MGWSCEWLSVERTAFGWVEEERATARLGKGYIPTFRKVCGGWDIRALLEGLEESGSRFARISHLSDDETVAKMEHPSGGTASEMRGFLGFATLARNDTGFGGAMMHAQRITTEMHPAENRNGRPIRKYPAWDELASNCVDNAEVMFYKWLPGMKSPGAGVRQPRLPEDFVNGYVTQPARTPEVNHSRSTAISK